MRKFQVIYRLTNAIIYATIYENVERRQQKVFVHYSFLKNLMRKICFFDTREAFIVICVRSEIVFFFFFGLLLLFFTLSAANVLLKGG